MPVGEFEITAEAPELRNPHCIASLRPWMDVGNVGRNVLDRISVIYGAKQVAALKYPSNFYDYTRYRPTIRISGNKRILEVPNTIAYAARAPENLPNAPDLLLLRILEPHCFAENFNQSLINLLKSFKVSRYVLVGGMYDGVPHTRPLMIAGRARNWRMPESLGGIPLQLNRYQGRTSMVGLLTDILADREKMQTLSLVVRLPAYLKIQNDYFGALRLLSALSALYGLPADFPERAKAEKLSVKISEAAEKNRQLQQIVRNYEANYDKKRISSPSESVQLSKEVEEFLEEVSKRVDEEDQA